MKKTIALALMLILALGLLPQMPAKASPLLPPEFLVNLEHNAPNTGKMLPERFDPYQNTYLLTVADWVSRITFKPTTSSDQAVVTVNGQRVNSGQLSQVIAMSNNPQAVQIVVSVYDASNILTAQNTYTVFLQRRPSERRTRVSAGYITQIDLKDNIATISADLVTLTYQEKSNLSTFYNDTVYIYKYKTSPNCLFFYGTRDNQLRAVSAHDFVNNYLSYGSNLYYLVYIQDEIVAVFPYGPD